LIDVLAITETKLDASFPIHQFHLDGFKVIRSDFTKFSGGVMAIIRDDMAHSRKPEYEYSCPNVQCMVIEIIIRKEKWFFVIFYKSPKVKDMDFINCMQQTYNAVSPVAKETIFIGDFNINMLTDNCIDHDICDIYGVSNLINGPTCFKAADGTLLDPVIVSNRARFSTSFNVTCGFSDFHNIVGCITKLSIDRQKPKQILYRSYRKFNEELFKCDIEYIPLMYVAYLMMWMISIGFFQSYFLIY